MDEMANEALKTSLCTEILEKIEEVKKIITGLEASKEEYLERKTRLINKSEALQEAKRLYVEAKEEYRTTFTGNFGDKKQESLTRIIENITAQINIIETESLPRIINQMNKATEKIEYYQSRINHISEMSNMWLLQQSSVSELEEYVRNLNQLLIETSNKTN